MPSSVRALSLLFVAVAAMSAGCNDDDPPAAGPAPAPAPAPTPAPSPAPVSGPASECFPSYAAVAGTTYQLNYVVTGPDIGTSTTTGTVSSGATFNGVSGLVSQVQTINTTYTAPPLAVGTTTRQLSYHQAFEGNDIITYGSESTGPIAGGTGNATTRVVFTPPVRDKRFTLSAGSSYTYTTTVASTVTPPGTTSTFDLFTTITYAGQESITVPAGTFMACKFQSNSGLSGVTEWLIKGKGILARSVTPSPTGEVVMELQPSSRLNGAPI